MNESFELIKAKAGDLEQIPWWRSKIKYLTPVKYAYVNNEPRCYYKDERTGDYWYRRVAECEMYRNA